MQRIPRFYNNFTKDLCFNYTNYVKNINGLILKIAMYTGGNKYCFWEYEKIIDLMEEKKRAIQRFLLVKRFLDNISPENKGLLLDRFKHKLPMEKLAQKYNKTMNALCKRISRITKDYYEIKKKYSEVFYD